jgi:hypothetical protein
VIIDGREIEPELARVNFLERTLRTSRVIDPPVDLDIHSAVLGVIFVYPTEGLPERVTMDWDLWNDQIQRVPVSAVDQAGPLPSFLEPDWRVLEWQNFLKHPDLPTARALEAPPGPAARALLLGRWLLLAVAFAAVFWLASRVRAKGRPRTLPALAVVLGVVSSAIVFWLAGRAQLSPARSEVLVSALLHNVYLAFDYREEGRIYDVLAQSVDGALLADIYPETRRGLELANQGGARAKVKEIELVDLAAERDGADGFVATATWIVAGSVGHWGHVHQRKNRYRAELRVAPVDGAWKLTGLEILEEERL